MRVLCCGDRDYGSTRDDWVVIRRELSAYPPGTVIIHGDCRGADRMAATVANTLRFEVKAFPVSKEEWRTLGKKAGPLRNARMLKHLLEGTPAEERLVLAFHRDLSRSTGTADMVRQAKAAGVNVRVIEA